MSVFLFTLKMAGNLMGLPGARSLSRITQRLQTLADAMGGYLVGLPETQALP